MTDGGGECEPNALKGADSGKKPEGGKASGNKNAAALAAALRANLARRKARERALRASAATPAAPDSDSEGQWTE